LPWSGPAPLIDSRPAPVENLFALPDATRDFSCRRAVEIAHGDGDESDAHRDGRRARS